METKNSHIILVLDESGSMNCIRNDIIGSINAFVSKQQKLNEEKAVYSLIKFNSTSKIVYNRILLKDVGEMTSSDYTPDGNTALFDAISDGVNLASSNETTENIILVIITDGEENSSRRIKNKNEISKLLEEKSEKNKYIVVYLNKGLEAMNQGTSIGFIDNSTQGATAIALGMSAGIASQGCSTIAIGKCLSNETSDAIEKYRNTGIMPFIITGNTTVNIVK